MSVDITKFPLLDSENTKLPLDAPPYRSRIKNFYVEDVDTKNYIGTAFRNIGDIIQAGELNEIYERQLLNDTLTHQMWSNWSSFIFPPEGTPLSPPPSFGPGWAGTTPLYPGEFDANSTALAGAEVVLDSRPYSQVEAAVLFKTVDEGKGGYLQSNIKLLFNTGWYLISDNTFVTPKLFSAGGATQKTLYDRVVQASGLKHWYYLDTPILFDVALSGEETSTGELISPRLENTDIPNSELFLMSYRVSAKHVFQIGSNVTEENLNAFITNVHDGAYFALDLANKSLCEHIDPINCDENTSDGAGTIQDSNPIQTTEIINDSFFANPLNTDQSDDANSRRAKIQVVPRFRHARNHDLSPSNFTTDEDSTQTSARSRSTNILLGNMNLGQLSNNLNTNTFQDKVPSYSLCVKCEPNTEGTKLAVKDIHDYIISTCAVGGSVITPGDDFSLDTLKEKRTNLFQQIKEGLTPSFINNVRVNVKIYDVDTEGDSDAENEWNSHFSELTDAITIVETTDLRQIEPI